MSGLRLLSQNKIVHSLPNIGSVELHLKVACVESNIENLFLLEDLLELLVVLKLIISIFSVIN